MIPPSQSHTHLAAVMGLGHQQHAANEVCGGHPLGALAFSGDRGGAGALIRRHMYKGCLLRAPKLPHPRVRATLLVAESTMVQSLAALLCTDHALPRYSWLGQKTKTQGVEGPRSFYQPKDVTGQENRIIKPQVRKPSKGVALILSSLLTPKSCLTTHSAKGIPGLTAQFELLAVWPFQELLR